MKHNFLPLSPAEEELMEILWAANHPYTSVEILAQYAGKTWSVNYLHKLLNALLKKEYLQVVGATRYNTQYARQFAPTMTKQEFYAKLILSKGFFQEDIAQIAVCMAKESGDTENDKEWIDRLEEMIEKFKQKDA